MEEAALEHQDQEEFSLYCMMICYLKPLVHDRNVPIMIICCICMSAREDNT